ncbi:MAG: bifunctional riboflavin kinase/FAD synthetase [Lachnospiraceae bacterium]|nr:bifunctional riboflavin kinase/FAD synthetase [Lachnospiraceae bacterium]
MEYIKNIDDIEFEYETSVTVGKFDGIHRGHEFLAERIVENAEAFQRKSVVVTFDKSPRVSLENNADIKNLITNEERAMILDNIGVDYLVELSFTKEMMSMEPETFLQFLCEKLHMKYIACGTDFTFGHYGKGNVDFLREKANVLHFDVDVIEKLKDVTRDISSTYIREEIIKGNIEKANDLLGYYYFVFGEIVHGNHIGTKMKMPTINILPTSDKLLPPNGVYVSKVIINGVSYNGVTNIGMKPTIEEEKKRIGVETHILNFEGDLYGKIAKVDFLHFVRPEKKFSSLDELANQISMDIGFAKEYFS